MNQYISNMAVIIFGCGFIYFLLITLGFKFSKEKKDKTNVLAEIRKNIFYDNLKLLDFIGHIEDSLVESKMSTLKNVNVSQNPTKEAIRLQLDYLKRIEALYQIKYMAQLSVLSAVKDLKKQSLFVN